MLLVTTALNALKKNFHKVKKEKYLGTLNRGNNQDSSVWKFTPLCLKS